MIHIADYWTNTDHTFYCTAKVAENRYVDIKICRNGYIYIMQCEDGNKIYDLVGNTYNCITLNETEIIAAVKEYHKKHANIGMS